MLLLAALCAVVSILFCRSIHLSGKIYSRFIPHPVLRAVIGGALVIALTYLFGSRDYNGAGMDVILRAMDGQARPEAFLLKILLTAVTLGAGFTSVMIDGSHLPYEENVAVTKQVVEYAHARGVTVEGELGQLAGVEDDVSVEADKANYTDPEQVQDFVSRTGVDSLAIAIGTSHGAFKFKPGQKPQLRFDILQEVMDRLPGFPIVLHGASSVMPEYVAIVNQYGGQMADAIGIPEDMLRQAASMAVCKINVDSDLRLAMTAGIRKHLAENPTHFDPRQYLGEGRDCITAVVKHKIESVLGCAGKA